MPETARTFRVHAQVRAFEKSGDDNPMRIGGIVSTDRMDKQDERVIQEGLDFSQFLADGWFNDNHGQRSCDVLGYPSAAMYVVKGTELPDGTIAKTNGWWTEGYLVNTDEGRRIWGLAQALSKSPRKLGFSIEGKVLKRSGARQNVIARAMVKNVAITHCPVNIDTELSVLAKAMTAGHAIGAADIGTGPGDGGALRAESLEEEESDQQDAAKSEAGDQDLGAIDEDVLFAEWAPVLHEAVRGMEAPADLSKAEAAIIIRHHNPNFTDAQVDEIIDHAGGLR